MKTKKYVEYMVEETKKILAIDSRADIPQMWRIM